MANPIYPIAVAAGAGIDYLTNYADEGRQAEAKREKDWLAFNERKSQPGFNADTDPYVIAHRNQHAQNTNMAKLQQQANAQPRLPNPNAGLIRQQQIDRLTANPALKAQFKTKFPSKYNELFNGSQPTGTSIASAPQGGSVNIFQPPNKGSTVASKKNNPVDMGHLPNKPNGNMFTGSSPYVSTASLLNPAQQQAQSSLLPEITERLRRPVNFNDISNETIRKYNEEVLPGIKNSFTGATNAKLSSPSFAGEAQFGGERLQRQLAAQRAEYELQSRTHDQNLLGTLMGRSQESFYNPGDPGLLKQFGQKAFGKVSEFAMDQGLDYLKSLFSSNPTAAASESANMVASLSPDKKSQLLEYVTTGAGKSAPQNVKDVILQNASPVSAGSYGTSPAFGSTAGDVALTAAGVAAAGVGAYYGSKWIRPLIFDQGEQ